MNWMRRAALVACLLWMAGSLSMMAQVVPAWNGHGEFLVVGGTASYSRLSYDKRYLGGISAFVDGNINRRVGFEAEARVLRMNQEAGTHADTYLAGPRVISHRFGYWWPYAKVLGGLGHFNYPYNYATGNYFVISPGIGVDYRLSKKWQVRVADVEYQYWTSCPFGAITTYTVSTGLRYRIR